MKAITRKEKIMSGENLTPITRKEMFLAKAAGQNIETPEPITREEMFLSKIGGGSGGGITPEGTLNITENGEYDVTTFEKASVNVASSGGSSIDNFFEGTTDEILSNATKLRMQAFDNNRNVAAANFPLATEIGYYAFRTCFNLISVNFPLVTKIEGYAFSGCTKLESVYCPLATEIGSSAFQQCKLSMIDLHSKVSIQYGAFADCKNLTVLILRSATLCELSSAAAFNGTPFADGGTGGTIYVPQAIITQYQNATNWSTLYAAGTCNFVAIEGSEYE